MITAMFSCIVWLPNLTKHLFVFSISFESEAKNYLKILAYLIDLIRIQARDQSEGNPPCCSHLFGL